MALPRKSSQTAHKAVAILSKQSKTKSNTGVPEGGNRHVSWQLFQKSQNTKCITLFPPIRCVLGVVAQL